MRLFDTLVLQVHLLVRQHARHGGKQAFDYIFSQNSLKNTTKLLI
jgi:hypothetical protein